MGRIFIVIVAVSFLMTAIAGMGVYFLSQASVNKTKNEAYYTQAKGIAQSISIYTSVLNKTLQNMAKSPELISAIQRSDMDQTKQIIQRMGSYFPETMAFRLLFATNNEPDTSIVPHMGYADLDLVKSTFQKPQLPLIQGEKGENRHLAFTQGVKMDDKVIAVILASINFNELQHIFNIPVDSRIYLELKQADFVLFSQGNSSLKTSDVHTLVNINNTGWNIVYWSDESLEMDLLTLVLSIILIPTFISALVAYIAYRQLETLLIEDMRSVLKATKDIMTGRANGNYPMQLKEMSNFVANIIQFKRVLDGKSSATNDAQSEDEMDLDNFFEESGHSDILSSEFAKFEEQGRKTKVGSAISLPEITNGSNHEKKDSKKNTDSVEKPLKADNTIFRAYDIRGIVNKTLTKKIVYDIGRAVGSTALDKGISSLVIAKDGRTSSPELSGALADGLLSTGINIIDIGTVPTPVLYFVAHHHDSHSGIMLTGSHNPADYNGLKIVLAGETLAGEKIQALKKRIENNDFQMNEVGTLTENTLFSNEYIGVITDDIHIARPMKVVIDAGNGVAGELGPILLKTLGCDVIELYCEIDGSFPNHHPDPSKPENLLDLKSAVKHYQADLGIAFDGDGDRLGVIDASGNIIWPDRQMMLFSKHILAKKPGADIIYDVKCSQNLPRQIKKYGGYPIIWKTGHSFMKAKVKQTGAAFAGEMSGHLFSMTAGLALMMACIQLHDWLKSCQKTHAVARRFSQTFQIVPTRLN